MEEPVQCDPSEAALGQPWHLRPFHLSWELGGSQEAATVAGADLHRPNVLCSPRSIPSGDLIIAYHHLDGNTSLHKYNSSFYRLAGPALP